MKKMPRELVEKSIMEHHNHSWYDDILMRNADNMESTALLFRGNSISYKDFFAAVSRYAKALRSYGIGEGDEFVTCLRQTPDYPILVAAASMIGAKILLAAADFDSNFMADLMNIANAGIVLVNDWDFVKMVPSLKMLKNNQKIVVLPVSMYESADFKYREITEKFYKLDEQQYKKAISDFDNIISAEDFLNHGEEYQGEVHSDAGLDADLAITFTSGSTKKGYHKGVVQKNRSYVVMGRYHDPEVAGIPKMKNTITLVPIGVQADTTLMTGVSDTLVQGGIVALDPIIDKDYFIYSMMINNAGLVVAARPFWMSAMKMTYTNPELKDIKLPGLYVPSEGGEPLTAGEEYALNKWLKHVKAGTAITHTPFSIAKMTVGGGDTESGSVFLTLYRGYYSFLQRIRGIDEPIGLTPYDFADVQALRTDGTYCENMELGRLVCNSATQMDRYYNDPESTEAYFINDASGKRWGNLNVYGYIDKWNNVYVKGRIGKDDPEIKTFEVSDAIVCDYKNIMSCEVVVVDGMYIAHIEMQFMNGEIDVKKVLAEAKSRCIKKFGKEFENKLLFRVRTFEESFPLLFTTKRNVNALREEGIEKAIRV